MYLLNQLNSHNFFSGWNSSKVKKNITKDGIVYRFTLLTIKKIRFYFILFWVCVLFFMAFSSGCLREFQVLILRMKEELFNIMRYSIPWVHIAEYVHTYLLTFTLYFCSFFHFFICGDGSFVVLPPNAVEWFIFVFIARGFFQNIRFTSLWEIESLWMHTSFI